MLRRYVRKVLRRLILIVVRRLLMLIGRLKELMEIFVCRLNNLSSRSRGNRTIVRIIHWIKNRSWIISPTIISQSQKLKSILSINSSKMRMRKEWLVITRNYWRFYWRFLGSKRKEEIYPCQSFGAHHQKTHSWTILWRKVNTRIRIWRKAIKDQSYPRILIKDKRVWRISYKEHVNQ